MAAGQVLIADPACKERRIENCRYVEDAASIRVNDFCSVGQDSC